MNAVFADTVGLLAVWDRSDQWHEAAARAFAETLASRTPFFTTTYVMIECGNAASRRPFRNDVDELRQQLQAADALIRPTRAEWNQAWISYRRGEAGNAGIVDHVSFLVMRRLGITRAFTNDQHFKSAGFETLF